MNAQRFTVDQDRVQRLIAAGEAALAAEHEFADAERDVRARLSRVKMMRQHEEASEPRRVGFAASIGGERVIQIDPSRHEPEIARLEEELQRTLRQRADGATRRQHDIRISSRLRDFLGERSNFTMGAVR